MVDILIKRLELLCWYFCLKQKQTHTVIKYDRVYTQVNEHIFTEEEHNICI